MEHLGMLDPFLNLFMIIPYPPFHLLNSTEFLSLGFWKGFPFTSKFSSWIYVNLNICIKMTTRNKEVQLQTHDMVKLLAMVKLRCVTPRSPRCCCAAPENLPVDPTFWVSNFRPYRPCVGVFGGYIWVLPKITVPPNGWFIMENTIKMDDLGIPLFLETPISGH